MSTLGTNDIGPKERFYRYFQQQVSALQEQMDKLADFSPVGGERTDATDHCLAGIARLVNEVKDASSYLPAYDQRTYSETTKALSERLQETRATFQPKTRFAFKTARKDNSAVPPNNAAEIASAQRVKISDHYSDPSSATASFITSPTPALSPPNRTNNDEKSSDSNSQNAQSAAICKPSFSESTTVQISDHNDAHVLLPSSASHAASSGSLISLKRCVVDLSVPTTSGKPFSGLALKNIRDSLVVCGQVDGPAHLTDVENSAVVVTCRQFRMHDCKGVDVYLLCSSRPIIEDCSGIRFAPLPESYIPESEQPIENHWDEVDDFKWLKAEHSPNWSVLSPEKRIAPRVWREVVPGGPGIALNDILKETILERQ